ncbi:hypothetical protein RUM44_001636 [Polyplax serrata]|uniref:Apolipophorin n=1 Tax=Polyplax serrata TaxID=468196 RepID=A0ABR1AKU4_POLSC
MTWQKSKESGSLLKLEEGVTYHYNLEGNTETLLPKSKGPHGENVKLNFRAKVEVASFPQCKTVVQLRNVQVIGPDGKTHQSLPKLEQYPLAVSLHGGKLDTEVCAVHDDDFASLNIKRAIASLLQVNTGENGGNSVETDVFGVCPTHFKVTRDGDGMVVSKSRDLEKCQYRESLRQSFFAVAHGHASDLQSSPLLDSQFEVEQRLKNGILESATVKEDYLFRPFSNRDSGARTKVLTKLVLESKVPSTTVDVPAGEPRQIFFENPHETVTCTSQTLMNALHKVANSEYGVVSTTAAKDFGDLIKLMRRASKEDLLSAYGNCKAGAGFPDRQLAKKVFTDALFAAGSADSVSAAVELLKNNEITGDLSKYWYLSFAFVRHTSASALASAMTLLENPKLPMEAYLGIGALAGHYCREHNCEGVPQFDQLLAKYTEILSGSGKATREKENYIIAALKGLRNVKHYNDDTANKITHLMKDGHSSTRVRVAALEAAQGDACRGKILKGAQDIFYNRDEDSELRIKAYLVMVECPSPKLANKLSEFMETEPVNQVGAFVTSHLRNLRSSYNPDKEYVREILYNVKPRKKFPFDVRKFSQNHEFSYNFDALSSSAAAETNVIFSQKSYLPRSVNLNLTVEVFGHAFNLFELNGRAENLEKVYEKYVGPKGYFKTHKPLEVLKDVRDLYRDIATRVDDRYKNIVGRHRRSVSKADTDRFASKVKLFNSKLDSNIDVDLSMKVLGNELSWVNIEDVETPLTPSVVIDKVATFLENGLGSAKDYRRNYRNHFHFLDSQLTYPTSMGLPLKLSAVGSGVVYFKFESNCDVSAFLKDPKNGYGKFEIVPSASIDVTGEFSVDGYAVEAGVKLSGNLHSSTGSEVTLKMLNGHGFDVNVGLPVKKSDILSVNTEIFSFVRERGQLSSDSLLEFNVARKDYHGCFDQLQPLVGLTFCGDIGFPSDQQSLVSSAAAYPLNGHSKLSFRLEKEDETLTTYHMKFFFDLANKNKRVEFKLDTPGTKVPRELSLLASLTTEPEKAVDLQFISPLHRFVARGAIVDNDSEYSLSGFARIDDTQEYKARLGLLKSGSSYTPILEYTPVGGIPSDVRVEGEVSVDKSSGSPRRRYIFKGVRLIHPKTTYTVDGSIGTDEHAFQTDLRIGYDQHTAGIKTNIQCLAAGKHLKLSAEVSPSQYPDFNFGVDYEYKRGDHSIENNLIVSHGRDIASTQNKLILNQYVQYRYESLQDFDVSTRNSLSYPVFEVEGRLEGAASRRSLRYDLEGRYGKYRAHSKLDAKTSVKELGDYEIDFVVAAFDKEVSLTAKREVVDAYKSRFSQKLEVKPGKSYDLAAEVTHHFGGSEMKFGVIATSTNYPNYVLDAGFLTTPALFDGHCKVNDGSKDTVDSLLKFTRVAPLHGNFKMFVDNLIESQGEYTLDGKATGVASARFLQLNSVIKGSFDLMKTDTKYTGLIQASTEKDGQPKWQLHIETDSDVTQRSINSRNKVRLTDKQLELNFNGNCQGHENDRSFSGGYDLTLPSGKFFTGTVKYGLHVIRKVVNGDLFLEMGYSEQRGGQLTKYFLDTYAKNLDVKRYSVDSKFEIGRECSKGNYKFSNMFRSMPHDNQFILDEESSLSGSLVKTPFEYKGHAVLSRTEANFDVTSTYGDYHLKSRGKILTGIEDKIRHLECQTELSTPHESARRVQLEHVFHFAQGDENRPHMLQVKQDYTLNEKMFKLNGEAELHVKHGTLKGSLMLPGEPRPSGFEVKYKREVVNQLRKAEVMLTANYANDKHVNLNSVFEYKTDVDMFNGHITGQTSLTRLQTIDLQFSHKKLSSTARNTDFTVVLNGEKVEGFAKVDLAPKQSLVDLTATSSVGKSRFYYKLNKKSDRQATSEGQVAWTTNGGGQCDFSTNVDIESYDNFHILAKVNSEKLEINKLKIEIGNRATKSGTGKKINFVAQTADKKGFSGSVTYAVKEQSYGFTVEGKGQIEFQAEKSPITYKAEYRVLNKNNDGETGTSLTLNADFDKGNFLVEHKISDKEIFCISKFCKDGHCSHSEVKNKWHLTDYNEMSHDASILYQNNFSGRNDDFKAFSKTHRKGFTLNHETGLRTQERSYNMKYYIHDGEGGLIVELPHREVAAIASYDLPVDLVTGKPKTDIKHVQLRFDGALYLDRRNKPNEKGNLFMTGDFTVSGRSVNTKSEVKITHPALSKDLVVRARGAAGMEHRLLDVSVDVDIFNRKNQKVSVNVLIEHLRGNDGHNVTGKVEFVSKGLNLDVGTTGHLFANEHGISAGSFLYYHDNNNVRKEAGAFVESNPKRSFVLIKIPNRELLKVDSIVQGEPQNQLIETEINVAELSRYKIEVTTTGMHTLDVKAFRKENPAVYYEAHASISPSLLEIKLDRSERPRMDNVFLLQLTSNKNTDAKPVFSINNQVIKTAMMSWKAHNKDLAEKVKNLVSELSKQSVEEYSSLVKNIKKVQPDFKPLLQYYETEFDVIRKELMDDPQFKKFSLVFQNVFGGVMEAFEEFVKKVVSSYEKFSHEAAELQVKLVELYKEVLSRFTESYEKMLEPVMGFLHQLCDYACSLAEHLVDCLKAHEGEISQLLVGVSTYIQEFSQFCVNTIEQLRHETHDFVKVIVDQLKTLPIYTSFEEKYKELTNVELPQTLKNFYSEITFAAEDIMKTPELKDFTENLLGYLFKFPVSSFLVKLPKVGPFKEFTFIRYLKALTELPTLSEFYYTYRPLFYPQDNIPPFKAHAMIVHSHHFFTFDQKHYTFKGTCSYVLAQDFLDGNFSIVANFDNGKIKSIIMNDERDTVEMFNDNTVSVNGAHGDYPVKLNNFDGWVRYGTFNLKHKSGVHITKYHRQDAFLFRISGFYFGRTRGLLGTISNEHYDDYLLPNGHVASTTTEFVDAYKVNDACPPVTEFPPTPAHVDECTKFFSSDSILHSGFGFINHEIYREACDQHASSSPDRLKAACDMASAYVLSLKQGYMPYATIPDECVTCLINGQPTTYGQTVDVQSPSGKADVIIVFEQSAFNAHIFKELITPLIPTLSNDLKQKGLGDVEFGLIGYGGPDGEWPVHFPNNGKITYEGRADKIKFKTSEDPKPSLETWEDKLKFVIRYINTELGREPIVWAMEEANIYPFRQGSAKIILLVNSQSCPLSPTFPFSLQLPRIFTIRKYYKDLGLQFHFITPMSKTMTVSDKPDVELKNIVGFDSKKLYTFGDAARQLEGDAVNRPHLVYDHDLCVSFSQYNGGATFNSNVFAQANPDQQKQFVSVAAKRIAQGAVENRYKETCSCKLYHGVFSYPKCRVVGQV